MARRSPESPPETGTRHNEVGESLSLLPNLGSYAQQYNHSVLQDINAYSLHTLAVTEFQWVVTAATTMEDDSIPAVDRARAVNLKTLHRMLAMAPPWEDTDVPSEWRPPTDDMKVTVHDTIIRKDLMTGRTLEERELAKYDLPYYVMNPEEN